MCPIGAGPAGWLVILPEDGYPRGMSTHKQSAPARSGKSARTPPPPGKVEFIGSFPGELPQPTFPEVAFAGRSNVGKSSAINCVLGRKSAARVSRSPGRTQAINLFRVDQRFILADLPGYGFARVPEAIQRQWKGMVEGYLGSRTSLRLVICLVDSRHPAQKLDLALLGGLTAAEVPFLVVATKVDKLAKSKRRSILAKLRKGLGVTEMHELSSLTGEGTGELRARLLQVTRAARTS